jgi:hypothetical protein
MEHLREFFDGEELERWITWCKERLKPAFEYLGRQEVKHETALRIASAAAMWHPSRFVEKNHLNQAVKERLERLHLFSKANIDTCLKELDSYRAIAKDTDASIDLTAFWKRHLTDLPGWANAFFVIGLIQSSSAAAERGFSLFEALFGRNNLPQVTEELMETQMKARMNT